MRAPKLVGERVLMKRYGKKVVTRYFKYPRKVEKFFLFKGKTPVIIFPLTKKKEVIVTDQFRHGVNRFVLEVPGGVIKRQENKLKTVRRELGAETRYVSAAITLAGPRRIYLDPASFNVSFWPILALDCRMRRKKKELDKTEVMKTILIPLKEWVKMIKRGEVRDSKTITTTFLALLRLNLIKFQF